MNLHIKRLLQRHPALTVIEADLLEAYSLLSACCEAGKTIYTCGNGGSASDCEHIAGELMKSFRLPRPLGKAEQAKLAPLGEIGTDLARHLQRGIRSVPLTGALALTTAIANDMGARFVFAQQIFSYGSEGDVLLCISTSGSSENVVYAAAAARAAGVRVLSLSGRDGGRLKELSDVCIICPAAAVEDIQEYHLPVYHALCAAVEARFMGEDI